MSLRRLHVLAPTALALAACGASAAPQLKVLGVERHHAQSSVVLLEVVNRAHGPMQLERLQYSFGADHSEVALDRTVDAGASVILQVPIELPSDATATAPLELDGELHAQENAIERTFPVRASVTPPPADQSNQ